MPPQHFQYERVDLYTNVPLNLQLLDIILLEFSPRPMGLLTLWAACKGKTVPDTLGT